MNKSILISNSFKNFMINGMGLIGEINLSDIVVREIERNDMGDILDIVKSAKFDFPSGFMFNVDDLSEEKLWEMYKSKKDYPTLVAVYDGKVIGFATTMRHWDEENNFYIMLLLTHSKYRGLGAGTKLIKECFKLAVSKGLDVLSLHTWASNRAMNLYSRLGFVWVPHSSVYMVNFLPQLLKHPRIKALYDDPADLLLSLRKPPEKILINKHVAWRYIIDSSRGIIEVVFDSESKRLLSIKIGEHYKISITPPERRPYLKNQELELKIETSEEVATKIRDELRLLKEGLNKVTLKAQKDNEILIDNFKFGYKLEIMNPVEIKIPKKPLSTPSNPKLLIKCNINELNDSLIIICDDGLDIQPREIKVALRRNEAMTVDLNVHGQGKAVFRIRDTEEEVYFFKNDLIKVSKEGLESLNWKVTREEISPLSISDFSIWYTIKLCSRDIFFKFNRDEKLFQSKTDEAIIKLIPRIIGDYLEVTIDITALKDIDDELNIILWCESREPDTYYIIPIDQQSYIQERYFYPSIPKSTSLYRVKLPKPLVGYDIMGHNIIIEFSEDALYTFWYNPFDIELTYPIKIRRGERIRKVIRFMLNKDLTKLFGMERKRLIESRIEGDELVIRNNWFKPVSLEIMFDNIGGEISLDPGQVKRYTILKSGLGEIELRIKMGSLIERRKLRYMIPEKVVWDDLLTEYRDMKIELTRRGATPRIIDIRGEPLLFWSDEKVKTPTRFPVIYGGIALKIREENKDINLHLVDWDYEGNGKFKISAKDLIVNRTWLILGKNKILEVLEIENAGREARDINVYQMLNLSDKIKLVCSKKFCMINDKGVLWLSDKSRITIELSKIRVKYQLTASKNQIITAMQNLKMHGVVQSQWQWTLLPGERKKAYSIIEAELKA